MTKFIVTKYREDSYYISVRGHADYAKDGGPDIVCSACSMLAYTLGQALRTLETDGCLIELHEDMMDEGEAGWMFHVSKDKTHMAVADAVVRTIVDGFRLIHERYPTNVYVDMIYKT